MPYIGAGLRDTRNALIAEHLFKDKKVWAFYDHVEGKEREFKTFEACKAAWDDVANFARSEMHIAAGGDRLRPGMVGEAIQYAIKHTSELNITVTDEYVMAATYDTEGQMADQAIAYFAKPQDIATATVQAIYAVLLLAGSDCEQISFKV